MSKAYWKNVRIVDGTGAPAIERGLFVFSDARGGQGKGAVEYVGVMRGDLLAQADDGDEVLDLAGHTLLPGLFNVHAHLDLFLPYKELGPDVDELGAPYRTLIAFRRAAEALECGVTTIRNVGIADDVDIALKKAIGKGMVCGPNLVTCGRALIAHGGHGWREYGNRMCSGAAEFMQAARMQLAAGSDQIKLMYTGGMATAGEGLCDKQMTDEEVASVVQVVHAAGKKVCAHLSDDRSIAQSVQLGVDCVEHGYTLSEETARLMAAHGSYFVPTVSVSSSDDYLLAHGCPPHQVEKGREAARTHRRGVEFAYRHGVKICVGTDLLPSDPVGGTNATVREMELLTECGMSGLDVIKAATGTPAELCGLQHITGTLQPGLMGDFIVVEGKPDQTIAHMRNLRLVAKDCRLLWSELPCMPPQRSFSILAGDDRPAEGTFARWDR